MEFVHKTSTSEREFRENRLSGSNSLSGGANELVSACPNLLTGLNEIQCCESPRNFMSNYKLSEHRCSEGHTFLKGTTESFPYFTHFYSGLNNIRYKRSQQNFIQHLSFINMGTLRARLCFGT
jgi:hypothetical protein